MSLYIMLLLANYVGSGVMDKKKADPIINGLGFEMLQAFKKTKSH